MNSNIVNFHKGLCITAILGLLPLVVIILFFQKEVAGDLIINWLPQIFIVSLIMFLYAIIVGRKFDSYIFIIFLCVLGVNIYSAHKHENMQSFIGDSHGAEFKVAQYNINSQKVGFDFLQNIPDDVVAVVLNETNNDFRNKAKKLMPDFPYWYEPSDYKLISSIASRVPLNNKEMHCMNFTKRCLVQAELKIKDQPVLIFAFHATTPMYEEIFLRRNAEFDYIAKLIKAQDLPSLLIGDFNNTVWSYYFQDFLNNSDLRTDLPPLKMPGTWPNFLFFAPMQITIDHALVNDGLVMKARERIAFYAGDHMPVINSIAFR